MSSDHLKVKSDTGRLATHKDAIRRLLLILFLALNSCAARENAPSAASQPATAPSQSSSQAPEGAAKVAPPPSKANITYEVRKAWREILKWPDDCEQAFDYPDKSYGGVEFNQLADKQYLVQIVCTGGAYQGYQVYYFYDETKQQPTAKLLTFESRESQDEKSLTEIQTTELWGQPTFDDSAKELNVLNKFRGIGDCGTLATYRFVNGEPQLKELRAKLICDGKGAGNPKNWRRVTVR